MPAFKLNGILVYFAAWKRHIGLYPPVSGDAALEKATAPYTGEKGNLQFPLDRLIPYDLIERIVRLRLKQDIAKAAARRRRSAQNPSWRVAHASVSGLCPCHSTAAPMNQAAFIRTVQASPILFNRYFHDCSISTTQGKNNAMSTGKNTSDSALSEQARKAVPFGSAVGWRSNA